MPLPSAVRDRVRALLPQGQEIRYVFPAFANFSVHCFIVVTDAAITVLVAGPLSRTNPTEVGPRYPRGTRLGPVDTSLTPTFLLGGVAFEVDEEYVSVVNAADAEISLVDPLPPDPWPEL